MWVWCVVCDACVRARAPLRFPKTTRHTPFLRQSTGVAAASASASDAYLRDGAGPRARAGMLWCVALNSASVRSENAFMPNCASGFCFSSSDARSRLRVNTARLTDSSEPLYCLLYVALNDDHRVASFAWMYDAGSADVAAAAASTDRQVFIVSVGVWVNTARERRVWSSAALEVCGDRALQALHGEQVGRGNGKTLLKGYVLKQAEGGGGTGC